MLNTLMPGVSTPVPPIDLFLRERRFPDNAGLRFFGPGVSLFAEGAQRAETVRIVEGCVCLYQALSDGRRQILDVLGPGRLIGPLLADLGRYQVMTMTRTSLRVIDPADEDPGVTDALRQSLWRFQAHALLLGYKTVAERVATALLDLSRQFALPAAAGEDVTFALHLTRADLADWLGLTLATVSRCLSDLRRRGLIGYDDPKVVSILDRPALEVLQAARRDPRRRRRAAS